MSVAPTGISLTISSSVSLPSVSVSDEVMVNVALGVSSTIDTVAGTVSEGWSATATTSTLMLSVRVA